MRNFQHGQTCAGPVAAKLAAKEGASTGSLGTIFKLRFQSDSREC